MSQVSTTTPAAAPSSGAGQTKAQPPTTQAPPAQPPAQTGGGSPLSTDKGQTSIAESVVEKVAGIAAREVSGVHAMGGGGSRAIGAIRDKLPGTSPSPSQGVSVEVGERQAAVDLKLIVEYGVSIVDVAHAVRQNVIRRIERMTGLEVTEVNIDVNDLYIPDEGDDDTPSRVQ